MRIRPRTALVFLGTECPISNRAVPTLNELSGDAKDAGAVVVGVISDPTVTRKAAIEFASARGIKFPLMFDSSGEIARRLAPRRTPEAFVIDREGVVRYHGRIDDAQNPARVRQSSLRLAIDAVLAGRDVPAPETKAFGCAIPRS